MIGHAIVIALAVLLAACVIHLILRESLDKPREEEARREAEQHEV